MSLADAPRRQSLASRLKPVTRPPGLTETAIQRQILATLRAAYPDVFVFSVPNGGYVMDASIVGRLKADGLTPGVPDLVLCWPGRNIGFIEVKSERGTLSAEQKAVHARLTDMRHRVAVCRSDDDLKKTLAEWGVPSRLARP